MARKGTKRAAAGQVRPHVTLARRTADRIRAEVIRNCQPGDRLPSERELAELLGVSRRTVRNALAHLGEEGWLRVRANHGHVVTRPAERLPETTALMLPVAAANMLSAPFFREVFLGLSQAMQGAGRHLLSLFGSGGDLMQPGGAGLWDPKMRQVDSLIAFEVFNERLIEQASRMYPVVSMDVPTRVAGVSSVCFDHATSIRMAFKHLVDMGHRRIGFVGRTEGYADPAVQERVAAYRGAFEWLSMDRDERWELPVNAQSSPRALAGRWGRLGAAVRPTALIVVDLLWTLVPIWLSEGIRVPQDLSLVNIGVVHIWPDHVYHAWHATKSGPWEAVPHRDLWPPFANYPPHLTLMRPTTVDLGAIQMGTQAVEEITRRLANPAARPRHLRLTPQFVHGNTTAAPGQS